MELTQERIYETAPLAKTLGIAFTQLTPVAVRAELVVRPELSTPEGMLHGGVVMSLSDLAGTVCAGLNVPGGTGWTTVVSTTCFLRPVPENELVAAIAMPLKAGRVLIHVEVDLFDGIGVHCARTTQVLQKADPS
jgi:1,4-dihydroxy-2-naphthoyl-CoA hydrolase